MAMQALASNLNESAAARGISVCFALVSTLLFGGQLSLSSQDQASLAKETGLGKVVICTSRSAQGKKSQGLWDDVLLWL